jgi:hypothetical protein
VRVFSARGVEGAAVSAGGGEELLTEEQQQLVDEAADRIRVLLETAYVQAACVKREAADEIDRIRRELLNATGVEIVSESPEKVPAPMDVPLDALAELVEQCGFLLAGAQLLAPHVRHGAGRSVGAVVKADVPIAVAAAALDYLRKSRFYAPEGDIA